MKVHLCRNLPYIIHNYKMVTLVLLKKNKIKMIDNRFNYLSNKQKLFYYILSCVLFVICLKYIKESN